MVFGMSTMARSGQGLTGGKRILGPYPDPARNGEELRDGQNRRCLGY